MTETKLSPSGNSNGSRTVGTKSGSATSNAIGDGRSDALTRASQVSLIGLFIIGVLWCAYVAQPVIVPLLLAWSIATIMLPVVRWLQNRGVPRVAAVLAVTVLLLIVIAALLMVLSAPLTYWLGRAAELAMILKEKLRTISQPLALFEEFRNAISSVGGGRSRPSRSSSNQRRLQPCSHRHTCCQPDRTFRWGSDLLSRLSEAIARHGCLPSQGP